MKHDEWTTRMIIVLLAWTLVLAVWNLSQTKQIHDLRKAVNALENKP